MSLENPQNREELIAHCKMRIGEPAFKINVTDMQCRLRVKEAIRKYLDYHFDAVEKCWIRQEITPAIQANRALTTPKFVTGVTRLMNFKPNIFQDINTLGSSIFSILNRNMLSNVETMNKVDIYLYEREMSEWDAIWRPAPSYNFNKNTKHLSFDTAGWNFNVGSYLMYQALIDVSEFSGDFFSDDWLIRYTSVLIKEQWGENLSKFKEISLPGGMTMNADGIKADAKEEKALLLQELYENASVAMTGITIG